MKHPFKIIKGGQIEPEALPKFIGVDMKALLYSRIESRHIAIRNRAVEAGRKRQSP